MSNPHSTGPQQRTPEPQDDSPTPNIAEYIKSIPSWSEEEQKVLEDNMQHYPPNQNAEFKRLTLLMTNLPNKRLRDVSLRVKYMKARETQDITWDNFLNSSFGQQKVEMSPNQSTKSPRATPISRIDQDNLKHSSKRKRNVKKDDDESSVYSNTLNSNQMGGNSFCSYNPPRPSNLNLQRQRFPSPINGMDRSMNYPPPPPRPMYSSMMNSRMDTMTPPMNYLPPPNQMRFNDPDVNALISDNDKLVNIITSYILEGNGVYGDFSTACFKFQDNCNRLLHITSSIYSGLPQFFFFPDKQIFQKLKRSNDDMKGMPSNQDQLRNFNLPPPYGDSKHTPRANSLNERRNQPPPM